MNKIIILSFTKAALAAALACFIAFTATAQTVPEGLSIDNDFAEGEDGYYYVNMLSGFNKTKTITLPEGFTSSFKVYDDGGKNKYYSNNCGSKLILTAPTGYVLQLSGDITTELISDCLTVYDGNDKKDGKELLNGVSSNTLRNIPTIISSGNSMTLYFYSNSVKSNSGLDLTVKLIEQTEHIISVNTATGGSVTCNKTKAKPGEIVTLTIGTQTNGYLLSDINIVYGDNEIVPINWDGMNDNDVTFRMPTDAVTVTPIFTNNFVADNGLFLNMPSSGSKSFSIPTNVKSFKVYDNGGKYNNYSNNYNGLLTLTAPSGYVLQLFATVTTESDYDYLTVYDGNNNSATELLKKAGSSGWGNETTFSPIVSSGQSMTITFSSDDSGICEGLDLTVIVAQPNSSPTSYIIRFNKNSDEAFGTMPVQTHKYNATSALTANSFERIGYAFAGWATSADGAVKYTDKAQVKNIVQNGASFGELFAKWIKTLSHSAITISDISDQTYSGEPFTPVVTVKDGNTTLTENTDYTVTLPEGGSINAGDYTITITGKGNYTGTVTKNFSIKAKTLISNNVSDISAQTYTGSAIEPTVAVTDGTKTLVKGTDYEIALPEGGCVNAGDYTVTITGKGNYTGTVEKTFTINPRVTTSGALTLTEYGNRTTAEIQGDFSNISSEDKSLQISNPKTVNIVIFKRSFSKGIPATIMLPFNFTLDASIGSFYTIESVAKNDNGEWIATPKVVSGTLQANTPYIFKTAKDLTELSFEDENGITLQSTSTIEINTNGDWTLHGVYEKTMLDGDGEFNYGFAGEKTADGISVGDFIRAGEGVWADPMRCYLTYKKGELTKAATVLPDRIRVVFPDEENSNNETTDIIENPETEDVVTPVSEFVSDSVVKVWSFGGTLYIEAQPDMDYTIVDLSGRTIKKGVTHSTHEELNLNTKGIVIVKIGNKTFKLK